MSTNVAIEIKDLTKKYDDKIAVDGINLEIYKGECFGLLGPNGAGKSTTMKMMYCSALVSSGELYVLGLNVKKNYREIKSRIGVVPQEDGLDPDFTVLENLLVYASFHNIPVAEADLRAQALLRLMKLEEYQDRSVETLSGGMKRRLAIARGLINSPEVVFLDEPTTGLDPQARVWIWDFFKHLKSEKSTLVLTTHYMEEAEQMCDRVAIIDGGRILTVGKPRDLIRELIGKEVVEFDTNPVDLNYYLGRLRAEGFSYQVIKDTVSVLVKENQEGRRVVDLIASDKIFIRKPTLNDVFLKLAGHQLRDE
ncbi:ABC transporter ATP-binding protein [Bdellovibrio bacteriovorus]|uniref:Nod factor export ATP-binding protein I n=1 Tax=Bdellovibrio bacteriovorus (strain ATCC 15356 / DSM 50701 / NCIMB 9529 / HD100) TaxID=264462 RepID=Q6MRE9_BDEBA|nr:ABC transporter ATP-binding protein [Bdellovibrio bacteriovorus]AHZ85785.1 ATP-binding protein [Bdellovibrio bacteriovorus]BEV66705.1 Linearmycin resistance ATP-binding protein LnrL [Bdellovibrio bacteriovorus]CAE77809.1 Nod factor export ATP-binding protein I [Bdellovibrio bacteriovorus HD100]